MKFKKQTERFGEIEYYESAWSGKKGVKVQGQTLTAVKKDTFLMRSTIGELHVIVNGSYMRGVTIEIDGEKMVMVEKPKWYVIALIILFAIIPIVWANVPTLCGIFPLIGGAIGGAIMGVCAVATYMATRRVPKPIYQVLITFAGFLLNVALCYAVGLIFIALAVK